MTSCKVQQSIPTDYNSYLRSHRESYKSDLANGEHSPLLNADLINIDFFEANEKYKCKCSVDLLNDQEPFDIQTYAENTKKYIRHSVVTCQLPNGVQTLTLYKSLRLMSMPTYKDYLFLPFMDLTNSETTYGGGRYIDIRTADIDINGNLIIDFNKCYNPYCAYSDGYNCPIPPVENHLNIKIPVGEKMYKGTKKKMK